MVDSGYVYDGGVDNGMAQGRGQFTYENGSVLRGEFRDGFVYGVATMRWVSGATFTGIFNEHDAPKRGTMNFAEGSVFEGTFKTSDEDGHTSAETGTMTYGNGDVFRGNFSDDEENSTQGTMTYVSGNLRTFDGVFERDMNPIEGTAIFADGVVQRGRFRDGVLHGHGTESRNGNVYDGDFANGVPHGYGMLTFADRSSYVGFFRKRPPPWRRNTEVMPMVESKPAYSKTTYTWATELRLWRACNSPSGAAARSTAAAVAAAAAGPTRQTASPQSLSFTSETPAMTPVPAAA